MKTLRENHQVSRCWYCRFFSIQQRLLRFRIIISCIIIVNPCFISRYDLSQKCLVRSKPVRCSPIFTSYNSFGTALYLCYLNLSRSVHVFHLYYWRIIFQLIPKLFKNDHDFQVFVVYHCLVCYSTWSHLYLIQWHIVFSKRTMSRDFIIHFAFYRWLAQLEKRAIGTAASIYCPLQFYLF